MLRLSPEVVAAGGVVVATEPPEAQASFEGFLNERFVPLNKEMPGMRILNMDPPVVVVDDFLSAEECDTLVKAAAASQEMTASGVGGKGNLTSDIRTSTTLPISTAVLGRHPALKASVTTLLDKACELIAVKELQAPKARGLKKPLQGQYVFEMPQIAHYETGQHFLSHEDAFPVDIAVGKEYQRRATLLVYLNDVAEGGGTYFNHIDVRVQPKKGMACIFFPSFSNGAPDPRTLHTAEDAGDAEKWITQLWVSWGLKASAATKAASKEEDSKYGAAAVKKAAAKQAQAAKGAKRGGGFGARK